MKKNKIHLHTSFCKKLWRLKKNQKVLQNGVDFQDLPVLSIYEETLFDRNENPIRDENGNIARLFIEKYEGINYEGINND